MPQIHRTNPRTWREMFASKGGLIAVGLVAFGLFDGVRVIGGDAPMDFRWPFIALVCGGALWWWAARLATDAIFARNRGKVMKATVQGVQYIHRKDVWASVFPKAQLVWQNENYTTGKSALHRWSYVNRWQPGDEIIVFQGQHQTWWEGDTGPRTDAPSRIPMVSTHPAE